jgi:hypothetical protein
MPKDFGSSSESSEWHSDIGKGSGDIRDPIGPISPPMRDRNRSTPIRDHRDTPTPRSAKLGSEVKLTGLVGKKVSALRIPASSSDPVTKFKFDGDDLLRHEYKAVRFDRNRVFLIKKNARVDYITSNSLASDYVRHESDAAKDPSSRQASQQNLIVVGYSWALQEPEGLTKNQLTGLVERLKVIRLGLSVEENPETSSGEEPKQG